MIITCATLQSLSNRAIGYSSCYSIVRIEICYVLYWANIGLLFIVLHRQHCCTDVWSFTRADGRMATHSPLTLEARVRLPDAALSSLTHLASILSGTVKCVATSKQWVTAVEACGCKLLPNKIHSWTKLTCKSQIIVLPEDGLLMFLWYIRYIDGSLRRQICFTKSY